LKDDDLEARSKAAKEEVENLEATIATASLDEKSNDTLKLGMRRRMVDQISKITHDLETKAHKEEENITKFPSMDGGKEAWIYFLAADIGATGYGATLMIKEFGPSVAADMRKKQFDGNPATAGVKIWYMRPMSFVEAIEELKKDIIEGKYDEKLGTDTAKLIFDAFKDEAV
jgi:hypothetical protein